MTPDRGTERRRQRAEPNVGRDRADRLTDELSDLGDGQDLPIIPIAQRRVAVGILVDELAAGELRCLPVQSPIAEVRTRDRAIELRATKGTLALTAAAKLLALRKVGLLALEAADLLLSQGMTIAVAVGGKGLALLTGEPVAMAVTASLLGKGTTLLMRESAAMTVTATTGEGARLLMRAVSMTAATARKGAGLLATTVAVTAAATGERTSLLTTAVTVASASPPANARAC